MKICVHCGRPIYENDSDDCIYCIKCEEDLNKRHHIISHEEARRRNQIEELEYLISSKEPKNHNDIFYWIGIVVFVAVCAAVFGGEIYAQASFITIILGHIFALPIVIIAAMSALAIGLLVKWLFFRKSLIRFFVHKHRIWMLIGVALLFVFIFSLIVFLIY